MRGTGFQMVSGYHDADLCADDKVSCSGSSLLGWLYRDLIHGEITQDVRRYYGRFARFNAASVARGFVHGIYERTHMLVRIPVSTSVNLVDRVAAAAYSKD